MGRLRNVCSMHAISGVLLLLLVSWNVISASPPPELGIEVEWGEKSIPEIHQEIKLKGHNTAKDGYGYKSQGVMTVVKSTAVLVSKGACADIHITELERDHHLGAGSTEGRAALLAKWIGMKASMAAQAHIDKNAGAGAAGAIVYEPKPSWEGALSSLPFLGTLKWSKTMVREGEHDVLGTPCPKAELGADSPSPLPTLIIKTTKDGYDAISDREIEYEAHNGKKDGEVVASSTAEIVSKGRCTEVHITKLESSHHLAEAAAAAKAALLAKWIELKASMASQINVDKFVNIGAIVDKSKSDKSALPYLGSLVWKKTADGHDMLGEPCN